MRRILQLVAVSFALGSTMCYGWATSPEQAVVTKLKRRRSPNCPATPPLGVFGTSGGIFTMSGTGDVNDCFFIGGAGNGGVSWMPFAGNCQIDELGGTMRRIWCSWKVEANTDTTSCSPRYTEPYMANGDFRAKVIQAAPLGCDGDIDITISNDWDQDGSEATAWKDDVLDHHPNNKTIASKGCAVTSLAMLLSYLGVNQVDGSALNPGTLNAKLTNSPHAYEGESNIVWPEAIRAATGGRLRYIDMSSIPTGAPTQQALLASLKAGKPVILGVKLSSRGAGHFVLATGYENGKIRIRDPNSAYNGINYLEDNSAYSNGYVLRGTVDYTRTELAFGPFSKGKRLITPGLDNSSIYISLNDQEKVLVIDPLGRKFGYDPSTQSVYNQIPNAGEFFDGLEDVAAGTAPTSYQHFIHINQPIHGTYQVKVTGESASTYSMSVLRYEESGELLTPIVHTGSITPATTHSYSFDFLNSVNVPKAVDDIYSIVEDQSLSISAPGLLGNDQPISSVSASPVLVSNPSNGTVTINSNGSFTYLPRADFFGEDSFWYVVRQPGYPDSAAAEVKVRVQPKNDAPSFKDGGDVSIRSSDNPQYVTVPLWATHIVTGPENESYQAGAFQISNDNPSLFLGDPTLNLNGTLTIPVNPNVYGVSSVEVKLVDTAGTGNGGTNQSTIHSFQIEIEAPQVATWSGGGGTAAWSDSLNWLTSTAPMNDGSVVVGLADAVTSGTSIDIGSTKNLKGIDISIDQDLSIVSSQSGSLSIGIDGLRSSMAREFVIGVPLVGFEGIWLKGIAPWTDPNNGTRFVLAGSPAFNGAFKMRDATLRLGATTTFPNGSIVSFGNESILDLNGYSATMGTIFTDGSISNFGSGSPVLTLGNDLFDSYIDRTVGNPMGSPVHTMAIKKKGKKRLTFGVSSYLAFQGSIRVEDGEVILSDGATALTPEFVLSGSSTEKGILRGKAVLNSIDFDPDGLGNTGRLSPGLPDRLAFIQAQNVDLSGGELYLRVQGSNASDVLTVWNALTLDGGSKLILDLGGISSPVVAYRAITFWQLSGDFDPANVITVNNPAGFEVTLVKNQDSFDIYVQ